MPKPMPVPIAGGYTYFVQVSKNRIPVHVRAYQCRTGKQWIFQITCGGIVGRNALVALNMKKDDEHARAHDWHFDWVPDSDSHWAWMSDEERKQQLSEYGCILATACHAAAMICTYKYIVLKSSFSPSQDSQR
jgi:hypothetical protein